jgi:hypothetical protein
VIEHEVVLRVLGLGQLLKVRTLELYRGLLGNRLLPTFGAMAMGEIDEAAVRRWRKERLEARKTAQRPFGPVTVAKAYRLLHAIFTTAADQDRIVRTNPCNIDGGQARKTHASGRSRHCRWSSRSPARCRSRYRALILLATFADLRW